MPPHQKTFLHPPEPSLTLHGSTGLVSSLHIPKNGSLAGHLISGSLSTAVYIWDLVSTKRLLTKFQCDKNASAHSTVLSTHVSSRQSDELFVQTRDGELYRWRVCETKEWQCLEKTSTGSQLSFCPALSLDTHNLLCIPSGEVASTTSGVGLISQTDFSPVGLLLPEEKVGSPMRMAQVTANQLLIAYESADLFLWDIRATAVPVIASGILKDSRNPEKEEDVTPLALDVDCEKGTVVVGSSSSLVKRFKLGPDQLTLLDTVSMGEEGVASLKVRSDGKILTVASWDFTVRVFSCKSLKPLAVLDLHRDTVQCVEYVEVCGQNCVILGGKDAMISVWPMY